MLIVKTASATIFEVCFGKMTKRCVEDSGLTTPPKKLWRSNIITQRSEKWSCLLRSRKGEKFNIDFSCTHGGGKDCKRHVKSILLLLSLNTHNHVDNDSGTLGGVRKVHFSSGHKS